MPSTGSDPTTMRLEEQHCACIFGTGGGLLWVDIVVPEINLVVEVDGPWHFIHNTEEYTGGTVCRNWLIERLGYRLIAVGNQFWMVRSVFGVACLADNLLNVAGSGKWDTL